MVRITEFVTRHKLAALITCAEELSTDGDPAVWSPPLPARPRAGNQNADEDVQAAAAAATEDHQRRHTDRLQDEIMEQTRAGNYQRVSELMKVQKRLRKPQARGERPMSPISRARLLNQQSSCADTDPELPTPCPLPSPPAAASGRPQPTPKDAVASTAAAASSDGMLQTDGTSDSQLVPPAEQTSCILCSGCLAFVPACEVTPSGCQACRKKASIAMEKTSLAMENAELKAQVQKLSRLLEDEIMEPSKVSRSQSQSAAAPPAVAPLSPPVRRRRSGPNLRIRTRLTRRTRSMDSPTDDRLPGTPPPISSPPPPPPSPPVLKQKKKPLQSPLARARQVLSSLARTTGGVARYNGILI
jgi:hypothetical protein